MRKKANPRDLRVVSHFSADRQPITVNAQAASSTHGWIAKAECF